MQQPRAWLTNALSRHYSNLEICPCKNCATKENTNLVEGVVVPFVDRFTLQDFDKMGAVGLYRRDEMIEFDVFAYPDEGPSDYTTPTL